MNFHPDRSTYGAGSGVGIMIENLPADFNNPQQLSELLDAVPQLGFHLDIGHANLQAPKNSTPEILQAFGTRLRHVHLNDNKGGHDDLHLPLGAGTLDWKTTIAALKRCGYDGTITLEVFTPDRRLLAFSRDVLRSAWTSLNRFPIKSPLSQIPVFTLRGFRA
jgi:sugar phosphate isomerase/epimerase